MEKRRSGACLCLAIILHVLVEAANGSASLPAAGTAAAVAGAAASAPKTAASTTSGTKGIETPDSSAAKPAPYTPGYAPQGYPPAGYPPQGYPPAGYPTQGYSNNQGFQQTFPTPGVNQPGQIPVAQPYQGPAAATPYTGQGAATPYTGQGAATPYTAQGTATPYLAPGVGTQYPAPGVGTPYPAPGVGAPGVGTPYPAPGVGAPGVGTPYPPPAAGAPYTAPLSGTSYQNQGTQAPITTGGYGAPQPQTTAGPYGAGQLPLAQGAPPSVIPGQPTPNMGSVLSQPFFLSILQENPLGWEMLQTIQDLLQVVENAIRAGPQLPRYFKQRPDAFRSYVERIYGRLENYKRQNGLPPSQRIKPPPVPTAQYQQAPGPVVPPTQGVASAPPTYPPPQAAQTTGGYAPQAQQLTSGSVQQPPYSPPQQPYSPPQQSPYGSPPAYGAPPAYGQSVPPQGAGQAAGAYAGAPTSAWGYGSGPYGGR